MKRFLLIALSAGLLAQPVQLTAQQPYFYNGIPDATEYLNFLGGSGVNGGYGVQVGPYRAAFGYNVTDPMFSIYCVDYTHYARDGNVNVTSLAQSNLDNTRLGLGALDNTVAASRYRQAAYLASLFDTAPTTSWGAIHAAIWSITSNQSLGNEADRLFYLGLAVPENFTTAGWYVLTPQDPTYSSSGQEFLMRTHVSVPEPASFLLLATGLLGLGAASRKRLVGLQEEDA